MEQLEAKELSGTRDYIQDIAKTVGKIQQLFLTPHPNDWQKGLEVIDSGLSTPELPGSNTKITIDLARGDVSNGQTAWKLGEYSALELLKELGAWAASVGASSQPETPEFSDATPQEYDQAQAQKIQSALTWADAQLSRIEPILLAGVTSPILVYPHHFDMSVVWYPLKRNEQDINEKRQVNSGFSFGDDYINEPYFYVTAWPEPEEFRSTKLEAPAYWHTSGFSGAVVKYKDLLQTPEPETFLHTFLLSVVEGGRDAFGS